MRLDHARFASRNMTNENIGRSPTELMFGRQLRTQLDLLHGALASEICERLESAEECLDTGSRDRLIGESDPIFV